MKAPVTLCLAALMLSGASALAESPSWLRVSDNKRFLVKDDGSPFFYLGEHGGLTEPNAYGHLPLADKDPARPIEEYFAHCDYTIGKAESLGLYIGLLPTWGDKFNKKWGAGPEIFTPAGRAFSVKMDVIKSARVSAWWFNPRDGTAAPVGEFANTGERKFVPSDPGEGLDWVLVLDDAARNYPPPGQRQKRLKAATDEPDAPRREPAAARRPTAN